MNGKLDKCMEFFILGTVEVYAKLLCTFEVTNDLFGCFNVTFTGLSRVFGQEVGDCGNIGACRY